MTMRYLHAVWNYSTSLQVHPRLSAISFIHLIRLSASNSSNEINPVAALCVIVHSIIFFQKTNNMADERWWIYRFQSQCMSCMGCLVFLMWRRQELVMVIWLMIEFSARVWSAGCRSRYQELRGRFQFVRRPLCLVGRLVWILMWLFSYNILAQHQSMHFTPRGVLWWNISHISMHEEHVQINMIEKRAYV